MASDIQMAENELARLEELPISEPRREEMLLRKQLELTDTRLKHRMALNKADHDRNGKIFSLSLYLFALLPYLFSLC